MARMRVIKIAVLSAWVLGSYWAGRELIAHFSWQPAHAASAQAVEPRLLAENVISTSDDESSLTFTPDGKTAYFTKRSNATSSPVIQVICASRFENGKWSKPQIAPFSGQYRDAYPFISPDGSRFFFASNRPVDGKPKRDMDIWVMEKTNTGWSAPVNLGAPVNGLGQEVSPSVTADGTLYLASIRQGNKGPGLPDIYRSRLVDGKYQPPENLGDAINTPTVEFEPWVSPNETVLVFTSVGRGDELRGVHAAYNRGDLYISHRKDGAWTPARNLGAPLNSGGAEGSPGMSPDGKYFYFTSDRGFSTYRLQRSLTYQELIRNLRSTLNGRGNIYQLDVRMLPEGIWLNK